MAKWPCWKSGRPGPYCWLVNGSGIILMEDERCKKWVLTGLKLVTVVKLSFFFLFIFSRIAPRQLLESTCLHVILLFPLESWEDSFFSIKLIFSWYQVGQLKLSSAGFRLSAFEEEVALFLSFNSMIDMQNDIIFITS